MARRESNDRVEMLGSAASNGTGTSASDPSDGVDDTPVSPVEVRAWYSIDWDNSVYSTVGIGGFLPLLLQSAALSSSGFPSVCPNVLPNASLVASLAASLYPNATSPVTSLFYVAGGLGEPSCSGGPATCVGGYCAGLPKGAEQCLEADGSTLHALHAAGSSIDPTAYATLSISLSVAAQVFVFMFLASLADFGSGRKRALIAASIVGGVCSIICAAVGPSTWWLGMPLMIITNTAFGLTSIMYNAYLPVLVAAHPSVRAAAADAAAIADGGRQPGAAGGLGGGGGLELSSKGKEARAAASGGESRVEYAGLGSILNVGAAPSAPPPSGAPPSKQAEGVGGAGTAAALSEDMSGKGFAAGYAAGITGIILCVPLAFLLPDLQMYQIAMAITGVWWLLFLYFPWMYLRTRPGPPLPRGRNFATQSLATLAETGRSLCKLPQTLFFLILWMVYSDAAFLIGSIGGLYANQYVDWQCFPKSIGILLMFFIVPVAAMIGNLGLLKCGQRFKIRGKRMLIAVLAICCIVPAYALIGFFSMQFGVRKGWEMIVVATVYGFVIGPIQSYSRSVFASLIPKGKEVAFFSFFELTNRGSSALGPIVLTAIQQGTGDLRYGFIFVLLNLAIPAVLLHWNDVEKGSEKAASISRGGDSITVVSSSPPSLS